VKPLVGVFPAAAFHERSALFRSLAAVLPVTFVATESLPETADSMSAAIAFGSHNESDEKSVPLLVVEESGNSERSAIDFAASLSVDASLRGNSLSSDWSTGWKMHPDQEVLATAGQHPVWARSRDGFVVDVVSAALPELSPGESLRDRLSPGRCLAIIAVLHFLRNVCRNELWTPPPLRMTVIFDDPNVRWRTYGYVNYRDLVRDADEHDYHVSFAHIPLDFRLFDRRVVELFHAASNRISLSVHGNNHSPAELKSARTDEQARRLLGQALRRTVRFEQRTGLKVARVMVPPHEVCSEAVVRMMTRFDFEAMTLTRPYSWDPEIDSPSPYAGPDDAPRGFTPAEVTSSGLPVITRRGLREHEEMILRAFLGQPIVLYGHEWDLREGFGSLQSAASTATQRLGASSTDLAALCRSNYATRRSGRELHVLPFARRLDLRDLASDVDSIVVHPLFEAPGTTHEIDVSGHRRVEVSDHETSKLTFDRSGVPPPKLVVEFSGPERVLPASVPAPPWRPMHVLRRAATEARDRTRPLRDRLSGHR
jgi:hypothetical protein